MVHLFRTGVAALLVVATAACAAGETRPRGTPASNDTDAGASGLTYVALGDSYTAAPFIGDAEVANGCFRSRTNYPALVADALDLDLVDVSCSAASTASLTDTQSTKLGTTVPPQLDAVDANVDMVTVSIGANDFNLFSSILDKCTPLAERDPLGAPCAEAQVGGAQAWLSQRIQRIRGRLMRTIPQILERAPDADVLVVGYPQVAPADGTCPGLPLAQGDYAFARRVNIAINRALARVASTLDLGFVDVFTATAGHDVCSAEPWISDGSVQIPDGVPYHPLEAEQAEVAQLIEALWRSA